MSLLVLKNISKEYSGRTILDKASLTVQRGERLALTGVNGSGKSTLLKIIMGLEAADIGEVIIARNTRLGYISQNLFNPQKTAEQTVHEVEKAVRMEAMLRQLEKLIANAGSSNNSELDMLMKKYSRILEEYESIDGYSIEARIKTILHGLGLREETLSLTLDCLSGGEKMRVALARMLLQEPDILILDEPTNHLDLPAIEWFEGFLKKFAGGVILVSHDRYFLGQVATRVAELQDGRIIERSGSYSSFIEQKARKAEFILQESKRVKREIKLNSEIVNKLKSMRRVKAAKSRLIAGERLYAELNNNLVKSASEENLMKQVPLKLSISNVGHVSAEIIKLQGLKKNFGKVVLFDRADLLVRGGEKVGIIGPNGCGKTTLLNILMGKDSEYEGTAWLGSWVRYGYLGQELTFEDEERTIFEQLQLKKEMTSEEACRYLSRFQFYGDEIHKKIKILSGGELVRVQLACILIDEPVCLIMDEPTNHLDIPARNVLEEALLKYKGTVIAISHDRFFLNRCVNRILEISEGRIKSFYGSYDEYRAATAENFGGLRNKSEASREKLAKGCPKPDSGLDPNKVKSNLLIKAAEIEKQIEKLEKICREIEKGFDRDTSWQEYQDYNDLLKEINDLYQEWSNIIG